MTIIGEAGACIKKSKRRRSTTFKDARHAAGLGKHATESATGMRTPAARLIQAGADANYNKEGVRCV
jgi:hypothetical protein